MSAPRGEANRQAKLDRSTVAKIRERGAIRAQALDCMSRHSLPAIARDTGIRDTRLRDMLRGKARMTAQEMAALPGVQFRTRLYRAAFAQLSANSAMIMGIEYGVSDTAILKVIRGETW